MTVSPTARLSRQRRNDGFMMLGEDEIWQILRRLSAVELARLECTCLFFTARSGVIIHATAAPLRGGLSVIEDVARRLVTEMNEARPVCRQIEVRPGESWKEALSACQVITGCIKLLPPPLLPAFPLWSVFSIGQEQQHRTFSDHLIRPAPHLSI